MTTMTSAEEGGGGNNTEGNGSSNGDNQQPNPSTPPTTNQQQQHPPPSPLSGCYLLVVLPEPHTAQHKTLILNRLSKGFLSWDKDSCHVDLEKELQALIAQSPEGEEARNGERLIQYATENLVTEVLIYPQSNTLLQCIRNLLASFTKHRHIIHAGYTFGGNGSWILQDGTFSLADFLDAFSEHEVQRVLRAYENSVTVDIHCAGVGDWSTTRLSKEPCTRACRVRVNPDDVLTAGAPTITNFTNYLGQYLVPQTLDQLMEPSDVVGNIRFSHPTLYVFPGGEGDAALFGINGFNMLVDGGFARKACFWDFARHLDRLDAVLVTRINNSNIGGMSSVLQKKKEMHVYPQIGHFFCNLIERKHSNSPDGDKDIDPLILNLIDIGQEMMINLRHINLRPHPCYRDPEPINLYHKVGHGTLDMYVLSPNKDSREVREFMSKWNTSDSKLFAGAHKKDSNTITFPVQNLVSICALLVWQPANPEDTITRILFPGSTPQHKIFEGFERLRHLEFLKHTVCTAKSISPSSSLVTLKDKAAILKPKLGSIERETKRLAETRKEKKDIPEIKAVKKDSIIDDTNTKISTGKPVSVPQPKIEIKAKKIVENKKIESETKETKKIEKEVKETKKEVKKVEKSERIESETKKTDVKVETEKTALQKENKVQKTETKKKENKETVKPIVKTSKPENVIKSSSKPIEKKPKPSGEKKDIMKSSPTTPKKTMNGTATKTEISKTVAKSAIKIPPKSTSAAPAKSAKDANNRLVVERKNIELSSKTGSTGSVAGVKAAPSAKPVERKAISRRTKPVSPSKARLPISPAKSTRSTPTASVKSEKDAVIRKVKGETTDSSAVSTPSGIEAESAIKLIDKNLTEKSEDISLDSIESKVLADLKEEREVVEEIEAVLQKAERIEEARKEERFEGDDDITAEATDKKEEDMTEDDVTAEMDDMPKKILRKESHELTEEDEYLIVEKEEIFTEDSVQSGETEHKHHLDELESEKSKLKIEADSQPVVSSHKEEKEFIEEKTNEVPEKKITETVTKKEIRKSIELPPEDREILKEEMQKIITSATEVIQKTEEKDALVKKDSGSLTKETDSTSPDKFDSVGKPEIDQKELVHEKLEESQERISTLESGATTTAPTLPEDERIPLDDIKEDVDEKHIVEQIKEKDILVKEKEVIPETLPVTTKPEVKVLDVQAPTQRSIPRDVVKTPDEVADLPVHEEVDPKLYKIAEVEKEKSVKVSKDPQISPPVVKETKEKGMFSFFGKVADKFEKGIDKLTKKTRRDSDKDSEDKSSKSSSPKEIKSQEKDVFNVADIEKLFPKVPTFGKIEEKLESSEPRKSEISDIKPVIHNETAIFLQQEIASSTDNLLAQPTSPKDLKIKEDNVVDNERLEEQVKKEIVEDIEEVEAFVEEASKKFQNVKDSLQDSLESLEEKVDEKYKSPSLTGDTIKDTLTEVAEKLERKSDIDNYIDSKPPEKVKFIIPSSDDLEDEEDDGVIARDFKEAVRDVAGVLVGTAGIEIEKEEKQEKPKDVDEIVKKVAEVLREDDFLSEKALFTDERKSSIDESSPKFVSEEAVFKKVGKIEKVAPQKEVEEIPEKAADRKSSLAHEKLERVEISEEPYVKVVKTSDVLKAPVDDDSDEEDIKKLCEYMMQDSVFPKPTAPPMEHSPTSDTKEDVMDLGLEKECVKEIAKREIYDAGEEEEKIIVEPEINFQQSLSPGKAELVTVTPGSTPSSPKLIAGFELSEVSQEYKDIFNKEMNLENIIEEFILVKKQKITRQILEYIANVKCVPKEEVIHTIQEMIIKYEIPRENVTDCVQILRTTDDIPSEKRLEVENYVIKEFLNEHKKISLKVVEEISKKYQISKPIVIEIVEDVMIKRKLYRESVFDIPEESYFSILKNDLEESLETHEGKDFLVDAPFTDNLKDSELKFEKTDKRESVSSNLEELVEDKMVDGFVSIPSTDTVEAFFEQERKQSHTEPKVLHDFEAVEQEYKVHGISSTATVLHEKKEKVEESHDEFTDAIEADEKFVKETIEKIIDEDEHVNEFNKVERKSIQEIESSELSDIDTKEKYLDEAKEKVLDVKEQVEDDVQTLISKPVDLHEKKSSHEEEEIKSETSSVKSTKLQDLPDEPVLEKSEAKITESTTLIHLEKTVDHARESEKKVSVGDLILPESSDDTHDDIVKRMVVTASSEDGGHEIEICPSGTITFNKTSSRKESVQDDSDDELILRKDSLIGNDLDKDLIKSDSHVPDESTISEKLEKEKQISPDKPLIDTKILQHDKVTVDEIKSPGIKITEREEFESKVDPISCEIIRKSSTAYSGDVSPAESMYSTTSTVQFTSDTIEPSTDIEKQLDKKELDFITLVPSHVSEKMEDKILAAHPKEINKSTDIVNESIRKEIISDTTSDFHDIMHKVGKETTHLLEDDHISPIGEVDKELRKDSIPSKDKIDFLCEDISINKNVSKSPSSEGEIDEKKVTSIPSSTADSKKNSIDFGSIDSFILDKSTLSDIEKEIDKNQKLSDSVLLTEDLKSTPVVDIDDLKGDKFRKQSFETKRDSKETSPEKQVSTEIEKDFKEEVFNEIDRKLSVSKDVNIPSNGVVIEKIDIEKKIIKKEVEEPFISKIKTEIEEPFTTKIKTEVEAIDETLKDLSKFSSMNNKIDIKKEPERKLSESEISVGDKKVNGKIIDELEPLTSDKDVKTELIGEETTISHKIQKKDKLEDFEIDNKSKFPSAEKEESVKETLRKKSTASLVSEPDEVVILETKDKSKSPSSEKEIIYIDVSPEKISVTDDVKNESGEILSSLPEDKSRSASIVGHSPKSKITSEDTLSKDEAQIRDKENISPEKLIADDDIKRSVDEIVFGEFNFRRKSSSVEAQKSFDGSSEKSFEIDNIDFEAGEPHIRHTEEILKPLHIEKESLKKTSPLKSVSSDDDAQPTDQVVRKSIDSKDMLLKDSIVTSDKDEVTDDIFISQFVDKSKSSIDNEALMKETISKELITVTHEKYDTGKGVVDKVEFDVDKVNESHEKPFSFEHEDIAIDKISSEESKSELSNLDKLDEKSTTHSRKESIAIERRDSKVDKSKSPKDESESDKEDILDDKSTTHSRKESIAIERRDSKVDKSKSPKDESESDKEDILDDKSTTHSRKESIAIERRDSKVDKSKSPKDESESDKEDILDNKSTTPSRKESIAIERRDSKVDKSKSPKDETESDKEDILDNKSTTPSRKESIAIERRDSKVDKSKSPKDESESDKEDILDDKSTTHSRKESIAIERRDSKVDKSKSPKDESESDKEDILDDKSTTHSRKESIAIERRDSKVDKSKSPKDESESDKEDILDDKSTTPSRKESIAIERRHSKVDKSKSPKDESESDKEDILDDKSTTPSRKESIAIERRHSKVDKSKSPKDGSESDKEDILDDKSTTPSRKESIAIERRHSKVDKSKSPKDGSESDKEDILDYKSTTHSRKESIAIERRDSKVDKSKSPKDESESDKEDILDDKSVTHSRKESIAIERRGSKVDKSKSPKDESESDKEDILDNKSTTPSRKESIAIERRHSKVDKSKSPKDESESDKEDILDDKSVTHSRKESIAIERRGSKVDKSKSPKDESESDKEDILDNKSTTPSRKESIAIERRHSKVDKSKSPKDESESDKEDILDDKSTTHSRKESIAIERRDSKVDKSKSPKDESESDKENILDDKSITHSRKESIAIERRDSKVDKSKSPKDGSESDKENILDDKSTTHSRKEYIAIERRDSKVDKSKSPKDESESDKEDILDDKSTTSSRKESIAIERRHSKVDKSKSPKDESESDKEDILDDKSTTPSRKESIAIERRHSKVDKSKSPKDGSESDKEDILDYKSTTHSRKESIAIERRDSKVDKSKSPKDGSESDKEDILDDKSVTHSRKESIAIERRDSKVDKSKSPKDESESDNEDILDDKSTTPSRKESIAIERRDSKVDKLKSPKDGSESDKEDILDDKSVTHSRKDSVVEERRDSKVDKSKSFKDESESDKQDILDNKSTTHSRKESIVEERRDSKQDISTLLDLDKDQIKSDVIHKSKTVIEKLDKIDEKSKVAEQDDCLKSTKFDINVKTVPRGYDVDENLQDIRKSSVDIKNAKFPTLASPEKEEEDLYDIKKSSIDVKSEKVPSLASPEKVEEDLYFIRKSSVDIKSEKFASLASPEEVDDTFAQVSAPHIDDRKLSIASSTFDDYSADRKKSGSIDKSNEQIMSDISKRTSLIDDKLYFELHDDCLVKDHQLDKSKELTPINTRSASITNNKLPIEKLDKSISSHLIENQLTAKHDFDKSPSASPVHDKAHTDLIHESTEERKSSVASIESNTDSKGKDRSRSQSLFETGEKSPVVRSRAASLYEDKLVEKLGVVEHAKDSAGRTDATFEEKDELQLSQETLDDLKDTTISKRSSIIHDQDHEELEIGSASRKTSVIDPNLKDIIRLSKNVSPNSEPESSINYESDRSEPHIDEEITISENKRIEVETLLVEDYINRGVKINEPIFNQIIIKTSLPKYIINEIIEEIIIKRRIPKDSIMDQSLFVDDDYDDGQLKSDSERKTTPEISERKSSGFSTPDSQRFEEKHAEYSDYESPFHKAFMGGMTEIRTTHITTLSGKSTPDFVSKESTTTTETTIKSVPEKFEESIDDKLKHDLLVLSEDSTKVDEKSEELLESDSECQDHSFKSSSVAELKFSDTTSHPDDSIDIHEESIKRETILPDKSVLEKEILERKEAIKKEESETVYEEVKHEIIHEIEVPSSVQREFIQDDDANKTNIEIITTTTKTIITKKEFEEKETSTSSTKNIDEQLISLDSQSSEQSSSSILNKDIKNIIDSSDKLIHQVTKTEHMTFTGKDLMDHTIPEQLEQSVSPLIRDLISEEKSFSRKSDISLPKDISEHDSPAKSTTDSTISPLIQSHFSGRSTPEKKSDGRSRTATPEGFRSGDVIRTIVTTTRTMSDDGEIITTTQEVTEATNEKGETIVLNEKTDVKVDERLPENLISDAKTIDNVRKCSIGSGDSGSSKPGRKISESSEERNLHEDQPAYHHQKHPSVSDKEELIKISDDFTSSAMTDSFYAELPPENIRFSHIVSETTDFAPDQDDFSFKKFTVEKEYAGGYKDKDSKKYIDEADLDFEKALRGNEKESQKEDKEKASSSTTEHLTSDSEDKKSKHGDKLRDPLADWGSPLGLPSPKPPRKFNLRSPIQHCSSADLSPDSLNFDIINDWGEPLKLPSPIPPNNEISNKAAPGTPKKEKKQTKKVISENIKNKKRSDSPIKIEKKIKDTKNKVQPIYVDLTYVSHHGNSFYTALEFFKKVRARYYVFSGTEPSREVYDALLEAKKSWEDKDLEVTMIPTYDTDTLGYWVADNEEALAAYHIDLSPSASRCTINLQDHETSCSAYRLEF